MESNRRNSRKYVEIKALMLCSLLACVSVSSDGNQRTQSINVLQSDADPDLSRCRMGDNAQASDGSIGRFFFCRSGSDEEAIATLRNEAIARGWDTIVIGSEKTTVEFGNDLLCGSIVTLHATGYSCRVD